MSDRIEQIPIEKIRWPGQERKQFDPVALAALAETIKVHGVEQPITVFANGDGFTGLLDERRWRAGKAAGLTIIPAIVRKAPSSEAEAIELRVVSLGETNASPRCRVMRFTDVASFDQSSSVNCG